MAHYHCKIEEYIGHFWSLILAEYDFEIVHRAGKDNTVPDLLSRQPTEDPKSHGRVVGIAFMQPGAQ